MTENKPHNVYDAYIRIMQIIPEDNSKLRDELTKYIDSLWNIAPEEFETEYFWIPFIKILNSNSSEITDLLKLKIQNILFQ